MAAPHTPIWAPDEALGRLVAESALFRTTVGAVDQAAAMDFIHDEGASDLEDDFENARAIIQSYGSLESTDEGCGNWKISGTMLLGFEKRVDAYDGKSERRASRSAFNEWLSTLLGELEVVSNEGGLHQGFNPFHMRSIRLIGGPHDNPSSESKAFDETASDSLQEKMIWWAQFEVEIY